MITKFNWTALNICLVVERSLKSVRFKRNFSCRAKYISHVLNDQTDVSRSRFTLVTDEVLSQSTVKLGELLSAYSRAFTRNADVLLVFPKSSVLSLINKRAYRYLNRNMSEKSKFNL